MDTPASMSVACATVPAPPTPAGMVHAFVQPATVHRAAAAAAVAAAVAVAVASSSNKPHSAPLIMGRRAVVRGSDGTREMQARCCAAHR